MYCIIILGDLFQVPMMANGAPFVAGLPKPNSGDFVSPDAEVKRALYQRRGHPGSKTSEMDGVTGFTPEGLGNGYANAGNRFPENSPPTEEPKLDKSDRPEQDEIPQIPEIADQTIPPSQPRGGEEEDQPAEETPTDTHAPSKKKTPSIYEGGMYWKFLDYVLRFFPWKHLSFANVKLIRVQKTLAPPRMKRYFTEKTGSSTASKEALAMFNDKDKRI